jgi:cobalt/nickel transport system ATP-binding protein
VGCQVSATLELRHVSVCYDNAAEVAVRVASLSFQPGERVALLGLNGSGKTSLLLAVVGLVPAQGDIFVCATRVQRKTLAQVRSKVGFLFSVPEDQLLFPSVLEDVTFGAIRAGAARDEALRRAKQIMSELGIAGLVDAPLYSLSHGQKQLVALAGTLINGPPLLLLDEPSAGLDPPAKRHLADYLKSKASTTIVAAHDLGFVARLCDRYILLDRGSVVAQGTDIAEVEKQWAQAG